MRETLAPDGTWMIVEPFANDRLEDNLDPVGRVYYSASTVVCTPCSLAQEVGLGLGAQAGEQRLRKVASEGGFGHFRRPAETPLNLVFEARISRAFGPLPFAEAPLRQRAVASNLRDFSIGFNDGFAAPVGTP